MFRRSSQLLVVAALGLGLAATTLASPALATDAEAAAEAHAPAAAHEAKAASGEHPVAAAGSHAPSTGAHGSGHSAGPHVPKFSDINWYYGFFGEKPGVEPSFLVRPKGMATPLLATLINWTILVGLIAVVAKKQVPAALARRKAQIIQGMDEAAKMLAESKARLAELDEKLAKIDSEIERIKSEMARAGELERERILEEAVERRVRMERDAQRLIETELDGARDSLRRFVVEQALLSARRSIETQLKPADQQRMVDEAIGHLRQLPARSLGGHA